MINDQEILIRITIAAVLGALVGFERERSGQPAGLRTHIILVVGAALTMTLSVNLAMQFRPLVPNGDPARLAAQVVSGIGFLGAGAIIRYGPNIKGLTTAASLWTMAIVGMVVGAGHYFSGTAATGILLVTLIIINFIEKKFIPSYTTVQLLVIAENRISAFDEVTAVITRKAQVLGTPSVEKNFKSKKIKIEYTIRLSTAVSIEPLIDAIGRVERIELVKLT